MSTLEIIKQVLTSWQVIIVTLVIVAYLYLVSFVSRRYHQPRIKKANIFKKKANQPAVAETPLDESDAVNDELGLEEA